MTWLRLLLPALGVLIGSYLLLCIAGPASLEIRATVELPASQSRVYSDVLQMGGEGQCTRRLVRDDCHEVVFELQVDERLNGLETWRIEQDTSSTKVTRSYRQDDAPFITRGMLVLGNAEAAISEKFDKEMAAMAEDFKGEDWCTVRTQSLDGQLYAGFTLTRVADADLESGEISRNMHDRLVSRMPVSGPYAPMTAFIQSYDPATETLGLLYAMAVEQMPVEDSGLTVYQRAATTAWIVDHYGPQHLTGEAWGALYAKSAREGIRLNGHPFEVYGSAYWSDSLPSCRQHIELVYPLLDGQSLER
ncbi:MAG: hypothetical protein P8M07_00450 [Flavobacteriales bacterium]|nr:hypothetical protein [Flavobacteriales bacterium]